MSRPTQVDIAICTWNREALLRETLQSFQQLQVPQDVALSILIVNNNSTDATSRVIDDFAGTEFAQRHRVLPLLESQQGHTFSRNRAVAHTTGDLVLWTDDDVKVDSAWLSRYVEASARDLSIDFWGGRIEPEFAAGKPSWIEHTWEMVKGCFAARDLGDQPLELHATQLPYGANFAVRGEVQRKHLFQTELGRRGDQVMGEDEIELMRRLLAQGHRGRWIPGATVRHLIPEDRANVNYVYDYFVGQGRAVAAKGEAWNLDPDALQRESKAEYRYYLLKQFVTGPQVWVSHLIRAALAQGQAEYLLAQ